MFCVRHKDLRMTWDKKFVECVTPRNKIAINLKELSSIPKKKRKKDEETKETSQVIQITKTQMFLVLSSNPKNKRKKTGKTKDTKLLMQIPKTQMFRVRWERRLDWQIV